MWSFSPKNDCGSVRWYRVMGIQLYHLRMEAILVYSKSVSSLVSVIFHRFLGTSDQWYDLIS